MPINCLLSNIYSSLNCCVDRFLMYCLAKLIFLDLKSLVIPVSLCFLRRRFPSWRACLVFEHFLFNVSVRMCCVTVRVSASQLLEASARDLRTILFNV